MLVVVVFLVVKGFHTLYRSVVLNKVNRSGEFIQTRGRKMGGRVHGADMSTKIILYWCLNLSGFYCILFHNS